MARTFIENKDKLFGFSVFSESLKLPFKHFYMHQCASPKSSGWPFGKIVQKVVHNTMQKINMLPQDNSGFAIYEKVIT